MHAPERRLNLNLAAWRALRERWGPAASRTSEIQYALASRWLTFTERLALPAPNPSLPPPLFVLGHWRSGTTLLHEYLALDERFAAPTTNACMNPHVFVWSERAIRERPGLTAHRPMDAMEVNALSPQEDEFALLGLGAPSPYAALLFPRAIGEIVPLSDIDAAPEGERRAWGEVFLRFAGAFQALHPGRRLLLKSPPHTMRLMTLASLLPGAQFVAVVREPGAVAASSVRMWRTLMSLYALSPLPPDGVIEEAVAASLETFAARLAARRSKCSISVVRYEDLVAAPARTCEGIYQALGLGGFEAVRPRITAMAAERAGHRAAPAPPAGADSGRLRSLAPAAFAIGGY